MLLNRFLWMFCLLRWWGDPILPNWEPFSCQNYVEERGLCQILLWLRIFYWKCGARGKQDHFACFWLLHHWYRLRHEYILCGSCICLCLSFLLFGHDLSIHRGRIVLEGGEVHEKLRHEFILLSSSGPESCINCWYWIVVFSYAAIRLEKKRVWGENYKDHGSYSEEK